MHPFVLLFIVITIIYWDASRNKIGKIKGESGFLNMSAGGWALSVIFLPIIGFVLYLINRSNLIEKAKENPVKATKRGLKLGVLIALCFVFQMKHLKNNGSSDPQVQMIRDGRFPNYPDKSIADGVDSFFTSPRWESVKDADGQSYVNARGKIQFMDQQRSITIQFKVEDNKMFSVQTISLDDKPQSPAITARILAEMYEK